MSVFRAGWTWGLISVLLFQNSDFFLRKKERCAHFLFSFVSSGPYPLPYFPDMSRCLCFPDGPGSNPVWRPGDAQPVRRHPEVSELFALKPVLPIRGCDWKCWGHVTVFQRSVRWSDRRPRRHSQREHRRQRSRHIRIGLYGVVFFSAVQLHLSYDTSSVFIVLHTLSTLLFML